MAMANNHFFTLQQQNLKYKKKYLRLKKTIKDLVFTNAALCDQVVQIQESILCVKEERRFLFKRLMEHDSDLLNELKPIKTEETGNVTKKIKKRSNSEASSKSRVSSTAKAAKKMEATQQNQQQFVQTISINQNGRPIYPITIGNLSIHDLGAIIVDRPGYHTENWIYPIGFVSTRIYGHIKEPHRKCLYTCKIIDCGDYPRFEIIPEEMPEYLIAGPSADLCHAALLQTMNHHSDGRELAVIPQGEYFFGLAHPAIATLLQSSTVIKELVNFKEFPQDIFTMEREHDPTISYDALQKYLLPVSTYHTVPMVPKEELPPEELLEQSDGTSCSFTLP
ncbi:hypothetical protein HA402_001349 [Bradysia odoriphaga]|nr:hypothetical protein HA402_001349 [Bradysia odoriphaga]